jgi:hypothetical protein
VLPLWLVACSFEHRFSRQQQTADASLDTPPPSFHLHVEAWMDGRSNLIISGTSVHWHHIEYAAPGRESFVNLPTKLATTDWFPVWPDVPNAENRDCNCDSSTYAELPTAIPRVASTTKLTITQVRRTPTVRQLPAAANDYTLIVELTDVGALGAAWHIIDIDVTPN